MMSKTYSPASTRNPIDSIFDAFIQHRQGDFAENPEVFRVGNKPHTMLITCSDSRILPERLFGFDPGEVFVQRNAGNIIPPYGQSVSGEIATIEYAVDGLGVRNIIVCGHADCGAMKAVVDPTLLAGLPSVTAWLKHADTARKVACGCDHHTKDALIDRVIEENVLAQIDHLRTIPAVAAQMRRSDERGACLQLHGWVYDNAHATLKVYDGNAFVPFETLELADYSAEIPAFQRASGRHIVS
ncbi:carbonic anhydrase [Beijerinckia mobilis]|uniref:carbonic anhydrase n=1 Tax=Beijerinckia mobilis TaxID=231434 RepID=UPI00068E41FC|nr:carbonic anhydrase [Beijerinckia mobilis]